MSEPNKAVQDEELEALRAIYQDDWHEITPQKTAWGTEGESGWWEVLTRADDARISVKIRGRMTKNYPLQAPPLTVIDPVNVSSAQVQTLVKLLNETAKTLVGTAMIFDLVSFAGEWISTNHLPLPKLGEEPLTLMEEKAKREEAQRAIEAEKLQAARDQKRAKAAEAESLLNKQILDNLSRKEERERQALRDAAQRQREKTLASLADGEFETREIAFEEPIVVDDYEGKWTHWTLFAGRRESLWTSYTAEPASAAMSKTSFVKYNLPTIAIQKRIDDLVVEISRLKTIKSHNVLRIYAVKKDRSPNNWTRLIIALEHVAEGPRLRNWLPKEGFGEETARFYLSQILTGLAAIHQQKQTQKLISLDQILLCPSSQGPICIKLTGTGYARRIIELHRSNPFLREPVEGFSIPWLSPDEVESPYSYSNKRDIWHAGLVFVQMLFGSHYLTISYPDLSALFERVPGGISPSVADLLGGLLCVPYKKRLSAEEALIKLRADDDVTRRPTGSMSTSRTIYGQAQELPEKSSQFDRTSVPFTASQRFTNLAQFSRYRAEFEEVEFLGKGGFGEVVKVRNRLDSLPYAIKKVKLRPEDNEQKVLREVKTLSRVSNAHIVRYYGCWLEEVGPPEHSPVDEIKSSQLPTPITQSDYDFNNFNIHDLSFSRRDRSRSAVSFPAIRFANSDEEDEESDAESERNADVDPDADTDAGTDIDSDSDSTGSSSSDLDDHEDNVGTTADRFVSNQRGRSSAISVPKQSISYTGTATDDGNVQRILYIQMEFVENDTLREAISNITEEQAWRLFVQILRALAHLSTLGIVHRDLKPSNILLDAQGDVKIADFGLSTTNVTVAEQNTGLFSVLDASDQTSNVGTSLYIAPEVAVSRSYNEKADMYSLGIIFFEMCFPLKTGMERVQTINALRSESINFPSGWPVGHMPAQRELISLLLRHDPATRPSASEVLKMEQLPSQSEKDEYFEVIAQVSDPRSRYYPSLIKSLFDTSSRSRWDTRVDDFTFDNGTDDELYMWRNIVIRHLVFLFGIHGAVECYLPLLIPRTTLLDDFPDLSPVHLLDQNGKSVLLPSSNLLAMARDASRRQLKWPKRYHVGWNYTELPAGGQPQDNTEVCFDFVFPRRIHAAEAELMMVADSIVIESRGATADFEFHVSHENVLSSLLATVPSAARLRLLEAFKRADTNVLAEDKQSSLFGSVMGITRAKLDELEQFAVPGKFGTVRSKLEAFFATSVGASARKISAAFAEIESIIQLAKVLGVKRNILFRPTLAKNSEFFRGGFMFEYVCKAREPTKQEKVVAFGGRYDSLLKHFEDPSRQQQVSGVGMSILVDEFTYMFREAERAASTMADEEESSYRSWRPSRCDVFLAATSKVSFNERLAILSELWFAGVRADVQHFDGRSQEEVFQNCVAQNILFCVFLRRKSVVKVRNVFTRAEVDVHKDELANWLQTAVAEQRWMAYGLAEEKEMEGEGPRHDVPRHEVPRYEVPRSNNDVTLVLPKTQNPKPVRKQRAPTKSVYEQKAMDFAKSIQTELPVIGVELPLEFVSHLSLDTNWVKEDDSWRIVVAQLSSSEREYAGKVRDAVRKRRFNDGGSGAIYNLWLFSVREGKGVLLQLDK